MRSNSNGEQFVPYSVFHLSAQSIGTAQHEIEYIVQENNCKFIAITEHWKGANQLAAYVIPGYNLYHPFVGGKRNMEGLLFTALETLSAVLVKIMKNIFVVLSIYRPSTPNYDTFFERLRLILDKLTTEKVNYIICGDFNINLLKDSKEKPDLITFFVVIIFQ
ncbi:hypothetical protein HHI36_008466 [Cryptolaemus montrouzieri]|uniref:Endonuclease/exonuclease/phosphatase domain-containing protein n=1 Tax=Cryptolaemus montrouzieri TaxID=559131 RepID=A0ABD2MTG5_9CUCU